MQTTGEVWLVGSLLNLFQILQVDLDEYGIDSERCEMAGINNYLEEVGKEMRKVTWPSQKELISNTVVTIIATIVISLFIFSADRLISTVLKVIYG